MTKRLKSLNVFAKSHGGFCSDEILISNYEHTFLNHCFHVKYHLGICILFFNVLVLTDYKPDVFF